MRRHSRRNRSHRLRLLRLWHTEPSSFPDIYTDQIRQRATTRRLRRRPILQKQWHTSPLPLVRSHRRHVSRRHNGQHPQLLQQPQHPSSATRLGRRMRPLATRHRTTKRRPRPSNSESDKHHTTIPLPRLGLTIHLGITTMPNTTIRRNHLHRTNPLTRRNGTTKRASPSDRTHPV